QVSLSWAPSSGVTSYNIYRSTSSGGEGSTPYRTRIAMNSFTDTGLSNGTRYYYQVTAVNSVGQSSRSNETSATPQGKLVRNWLGSSGKASQWSTLAAGQKIFIDRTYTYTSVPISLNGQLVLQPANDDKKATDPAFIRFTVNQASPVYVVDTPLNATQESTWLTAANAWTLQSYTVGATLAATPKRRVWSKTFAAGSQVVLGGNGGINWDSNMYSVVVVPI